MIGSIFDKEKAHAPSVAEAMNRAFELVGVGCGAIASGEAREAAVLKE